MPGIFGHIKRNDKIKTKYPNIDFLLQDNIEDYLFVDRCLEINLRKLKESQNTIVSEIDKKYIFILDGEIFNWKAICKKNVDKLDELILDAYGRNQLHQLLAEFDGCFCGLIYDKINNKITIFNDRHGLKLLYYQNTTGGFIWGSELKYFHNHNSIDLSFDDIAIKSFMNLGYIVGNRTWFHDVRLMKPASIIEYDITLDTSIIKQYWSWSFIKKQNISFDDAVDGLHEHFLSSLSARFTPEEKIGVSLSGGLDSRLIVAGLSKLYPHYRGICYTFGQENSIDISIAKRVSEVSGWQHYIYNFTPENWFKPRICYVKNVDGLLDLQHMHGSEFINDINQFCSINLNGYLGDVVAGGGWINTQFMNQRGSAENLKDFYGEFTPYVEFEDSYFDIENREPCLYTSRARRFTNMGAVNTSFFRDQRQPFFGNSVLEFLMSLPDEYRAHNQLYSKMLLRYFPEYFSKIPWQKTGKIVGRTIYDKHILNRIKRKIILTYFNRGRKTSYASYSDWVKTPEINKHIQAYLKSEHLATFFHLAGLDDFLRFSLQNLEQNNDVNLQLRLVTLAIYSKELFRIG